MVLRSDSDFIICISVDSIQDVYNVSSLKMDPADKAHGSVEYGIAYVFLSAFDLDGPGRHITSTQWYDFNGIYLFFKCTITTTY